MAVTIATGQNRPGVTLGARATLIAAAAAAWEKAEGIFTQLSVNHTSSASREQEAKIRRSYRIIEQ